ncbi:unnamed protein product [Thelazia callipaeda]|uniref:Protein artemis n=1 Tax=Thelazia callipaeda TaxID=103827 RepID=A0A0N5D701_THECL|nr:unnamed protein product [Thelazia callipaeda]
MNPFCGKFHECNWISVDNFNGENLNSNVFFLSHCHSDHMQGLNSDQFYQLIANKCSVLYCHRISIVLLNSDTCYRRLVVRIEIYIKMVKEHIVVKDYNEKFIVSGSGTDTEQKMLLPSSSASVTFLDAQHIPGSVIFYISGLICFTRIFFEFDCGLKLLYTGDYRLSKDDWIACETLKDPFSSSGFKRLDALYFDNTFCCKQFRKLPTPRQSCLLCVEMVRKWLQKDPINKVLLWCDRYFKIEKLLRLARKLSGKYGHELFLKAIWDELGIKCHVTMAKYRVYSSIDLYVDCVTPIARDTRVHACTTKPDQSEEAFYEDNQSMVFKRKNETIFKQEISTCWQCRPDAEHVLVIRPSAIWFLRRNEKNVLGYENGRFCRLLYSGHSSLAEVEDTFKLLKPVHAFPNTTSKRNKNHANKLIKYLMYSSASYVKSFLD